MAKSNGWRNIMSFLRTNELAIKIQVILFLTFAYIHYPYKKYYERYVYTSDKGAREDGISTGGQLVSNGAVPASEREQEKVRKQPGGGKILQLPGVEANMFELSKEPNEWDWRGIPKKWWLVRVCELISYSWLIYASSLTLFGATLFPWFDRALGPWLGIPGHCLFMGRFVLHPNIDHIAAFVVPCFHLLWRASQHFLPRRYMLGPLTFVLQSEHDISKFLELMDRNQGGKYLTDVSKPPPIDLMDESPCTSHRVQQYKISHNAGLPEEKLPDEKLSVNEHFMRHLMCYQVHSAQGVQYKLRPNRTLEARNKLAGQLTNTSLFSAASLMVLLTPICIVVTLIIFSDFRYVQVYPGCYPKLDRLYAEGKLRFWSQTFSGHHLVSLVFDGFENSVIWLDSALALTFVLALTYFLNCDLLLYWSHLHRRLKLATQRMKKHTLMEQHSYHSENSNREPAKSRLVDAEAAQLSALINEIQCEMIDFFLQVERADLIVSDILTAAILIWLAGCAIFSYYYLSRPDTGMPFVIVLIQIVGLFVITLASKYLLTLRRCCLRSYKLICTLMAHEQTHKTKRQFMRVLEFFSDRNRTTYTLFQHYPYLGTTYIALIGWSLSCFVIAYALFGRDRVNSFSSIFGKHHYFSN